MLLNPTTQRMSPQKNYPTQTSAVPRLEYPVVEYDPTDPSSILQIACLFPVTLKTTAFANQQRLFKWINLANVITKNNVWL